MICTQCLVTTSCNLTRRVQAPQVMSKLFVILLREGRKLVVSSFQLVDVCGCGASDIFTLTRNRYHDICFSAMLMRFIVRNVARELMVKRYHPGALPGLAEVEIWGKLEIQVIADIDNTLRVFLKLYVDHMALLTPKERNSFRNEYTRYRTHPITSYTLHLTGW
ncbi:hypothetical protein K503DRAFT_292179 [Rhizopogon vinicolor AM-OR11-026]|uniref:Uncharacterized protein n=1 Tax=Rhizopogon vinicolor AM-OR11-026 TaxID=1314800 RepID=A0A1B7MV80_9AGAM|nr:hypothetical protein K503DRAFT_292179 [Rhizopogon vinicolor AM-OR11-026]